jgi:hypothetical protein
MQLVAPWWVFVGILVHEALRQGHVPSPGGFMSIGIDAGYSLGNCINAYGFCFPPSSLAVPI